MSYYFNWYRTYSDGWLEQGDVRDYGSLTTDIPKLQVTFLKSYLNILYKVFEMPVRYDVNTANNGLCSAYVGVFNLQTSGFCLRAYCGGTNERIRKLLWVAMGY